MILTIGPAPGVPLRGVRNLDSVQALSALLPLEKEYVNATQVRPSVPLYINTNHDSTQSAFSLAACWYTSCWYTVVHQCRGVRGSPTEYSRCLVSVFAGLFERQ